MNYLPFDLETALKHPERVVTRDGRKVTQFTKFEIKNEYPIRGVIDFNNIQSWNLKGVFLSGKSNDNDLFLLPEVKECWVNVYETTDGTLATYYCDTKDNAERSAKCEGPMTYIKTIRITNEPE